MENWKNIYHTIENLEETLYRLTQKKIELDGFRPIPPIAIKSIKEALTIEWTYNSNSIEGNTLTLQETKMVIEEGFTIKGKTLREHFEAVNHQEAIEYIESLVQPDYVLNEKDILNTHFLVLQKIEKEFAGRYRTGGVRISGANFIPPNALKVDELMTELLQWVNKEAKSLHPIVAASVFHHRFVHIHPFFDGNGRTARLAFNLVLMKAGYPPAIILKNDRKKYYDALNKANEGEYGRLILLVMQAVERSLNIYLNALTNNDDYQPISQLVNEPESRYGQEYISLLARTGKIDAYKEGRVWYTSEKAIQEYLESRKRKRK
jgi:Fic family protein